MSVLFSPVGNSDPWRNNRDGAMLHIVRHYQPNQVCLFFTKSIWEGNHKFSGHKHFHWEQIIKRISPETEVFISIHEIKNEHDFDSYKDIFHEILEDFRKNYKEILLNVTSGTPQMETTLCLEYVTYPENTKCIQVATPVAGSNANIEYSKIEDKEIEFEIVNEEEEEHESRCKEIDIISFRETIIRNQLKVMIENYDYEAAYQLLVGNLEYKNRKQIMSELLRIKDCIKAHTIIEEIDKKKLKYNSKKVLFHYELLRMKFERGDIAELLIRIKSVGEFIIYDHLSRNEKSLLEKKGINVKLQDNLDQQFLNQYIIELRKQNMQYNPNIQLSLKSYDIIYTVLGKYPDMKNHAENLLKINKIRNDVAHNLDELVVDKTVRDNIKNAVNSIKEMILTVYSDVSIKDLDTFNQINERLTMMI